MLGGAEGSVSGMAGARSLNWTCTRVYISVPYFQPWCIVCLSVLMINVPSCSVHMCQLFTLMYFTLVPPELQEALNYFGLVLRYKDGIFHSSLV